MDKKVRPIPPPQADFLVLQTVVALLTTYIDKPELVRIAEVVSNGTKLRDFNEMDAAAFVAACARLRDEFDIRADNLMRGNEEWMQQRERAN